MFAFFLALIVALALIPGSVSDQSSNTSAATRGVGELLDYCDDNWTILPSQFFVGNCDNGKGSRDWMSIDLSNCFTVTDNGDIALDNYHIGGFSEKCDRCSRCTDRALDACMMCRCNHTVPSPGRNWAKIDLDGPVFVHQKKHMVCCGEFWGGSYCGSLGKPLMPNQPGLIAYYDAENGP